MSTPVTTAWAREDYDRDAREYRATLPLEHFMEGSLQATQREATLASLEWLRAARGDIGYFNEMLVQSRKDNKTERVVPDNMIVLGDPGAQPRQSWALELETCPLFMALEYVSKNNPEKDYARNFEKYEGVFRFAYYLLFDPEERSLLLYRLREGRFVPVESDRKGRFLVPQLEVAVGLLDGWVRFWFREELIPLSRELREQMRTLQKEMEKLQAAVTKLQSENQNLATTATGLQGQLKQTTDRLRQRDEHLQLRDEQLQQRDEQLQQAREKEATMLKLLRTAVEARARQVGRQDVVDHLAVADLVQVQAWLVELG